MTTERIRPRRGPRIPGTPLEFRSLEEIIQTFTEPTGRIGPIGINVPLLQAGGILAGLGLPGLLRPRPRGIPMGPGAPFRALPPGTVMELPAGRPRLALPPPPRVRPHPFGRTPPAPPGRFGVRGPEAGIRGTPGAGVEEIMGGRPRTTVFPPRVPPGPRPTPGAGRRERVRGLPLRESETIAARSTVTDPGVVAQEVRRTLPNLAASVQRRIINEVIQLRRGGLRGAVRTITPALGAAGAAGGLAALFTATRPAPDITTDRPVPTAVPSTGAPFPPETPPSPAAPVSPGITPLAPVVTPQQAEQAVASDPSRFRTVTITDPVTGLQRGALVTDVMDFDPTTGQLIKVGEEIAWIGEEPGVEQRRTLEQQQMEIQRLQTAIPILLEIMRQETEPGARIRAMARRARGEVSPAERFLSQMFPGMVSPGASTGITEAIPAAGVSPEAMRLLGVEATPTPIGEAVAPSPFEPGFRALEPGIPIRERGPLRQIPLLQELANLSPEEQEQLDALAEVLFGTRLSTIARQAQAALPPGPRRVRATITPR